MCVRARSAPLAVPSLVITGAEYQTEANGVYEQISSGTQQEMMCYNKPVYQCENCSTAEDPYFLRFYGKLWDDPRWWWQVTSGTGCGYSNATNKMASQPFACGVDLMD